MAPSPRGPVERQRVPPTYARTASWLGVWPVAADEPPGQDGRELFAVCRSPSAADGCVVLTGEYKERRLVHRDGDWHRSVQVWVVAGEDEQRKVLLQRRSAHKDVDPGTLDVSCAGHVSGADSVRETVVKELAEELGIVDVPSFGTLRPLFTCCASNGDPCQGVADNEWQYVFALVKHAHLPNLSAADFYPNPSEVDEVLVVDTPGIKTVLESRSPRWLDSNRLYISQLMHSLQAL
ncbi:Nudix hydrolase 3 [Diplonema papillatum]|nr:Nudix hydrolase 3 [Diplonema papillatum]